MPLRKGTGRKTVSQNIKTMVHEYERDGTIGNSQPKTRAKAVKQAVAIALDKAGKSRRRGRAGSGATRSTR
jgi:hypothetical protein